MLTVQAVQLCAGAIFAHVQHQEVRVGGDDDLHRVGAAWANNAIVIGILWLVVFDFFSCKGVRTPAVACT